MWFMFFSHETCHALVVLSRPQRMAEGLSGAGHIIFNDTMPLLVRVS
jgi:hypothetical protein